ncbi:unnamed protein product [Rhizoctonia solani]|uniref:Radical SAM core domain-containing protein n=1 Tax=Rhizoctonia solani TaxID=456999 RepID=A0A8H2XWE2_9AGAM|nr:unnamed protein product [Rhizoctonia solani]
MLCRFARSSTRSVIARGVVRGHATAVSLPAAERAEEGSTLRNSWTKSEISEIYHGPLLDLVFRAAAVHRKHFDPSKIQMCTLMNIKTGGCTEDCSYCSQSSRYSTPTEASRLLQNEPVIQAALKAKENGSTRFCMGAAWRDLQGRKSGFNRILEMVREIRGMGMEVCTTLGMLSPEQARQLKEAGLTAYNHNLDTSREFYPKVITTRSYDERLATIEAVQDAGINVCSGGILGLALPSTIIRLSAGRHKFSEAEQMMCFMAGANAVFTGEKMLTTPCSSWDEDKEMFSRWGLEGMRSFEQAAVREKELPRYPEIRFHLRYQELTPRSAIVVSIGAGAGGSINMLARVTIVDYWGNEIMDTYVRPTEPVVNYRTTQTNITEKHLSNMNPEALPFDVVQTKVSDLIRNFTVVGYALWNDLSILGLSHPAIDTRDVALYLPFRDDMNQSNLPKLPTLVRKFMQRHIQCSLPDSAENARACMDLFRCTEGDWERYVNNRDWPCALPPTKFLHQTLPSLALLLRISVKGPIVDKTSTFTQLGYYYTMQLATNEVDKTVVNLADLCQSEETFIEKASRDAHIDKQHAWAVGNTIRTLMLDVPAPSAWPYFAVPALSLVPLKGTLPDSKVLKQIYDLTCASNRFAQDNSIGSLLAGSGSESDEFADVGFWCGEIDENNKEASILQSLSLDPWAQKGTITKLDDAPLKTLRKSEMWELCEVLADLTEFRVERPDTGGHVMHVMAGKGLEGWCGMIGVGVWSDE